MRKADILVVGAGLVGSALAYGLAEQGLRVTLLDGADRDFRAARANFGIIWVQGKGPDMPPYQRLTRRSANLWPEFARDLTLETGTRLDYARPGGLTFCLGEAEFAARHAYVAKLAAQLNEGSYDTEMMGRDEVQRLLPGVALGKEVSGASYCAADGHASPLRLLLALQSGLQKRGVHLAAGAPVEAITPSASGFVVTTAEGQHAAERIVISAGNHTGTLAAMVGLDVPLRPQRGQILVTERMAPILPLPTVPLRQTAEGSILIGSSQEEVGYDTGATAATGAAMASRAVRILPALGDATIVRQWGGLRVMTPDSYPIYAQSPAWPGAFVTLCHSGVTLAAVHAREVAAAISKGTLPEVLTPFHYRRFDVPKAA